jgi:hypothetical protein
MSRFGVHGPSLQAAMFSSDEHPAVVEVERIANLARLGFAG